MAGRHALTREAVQAAFVAAYVDWGRVSETGEPEAEVGRSAILDVLKVFRKSPERDLAPPADEFGPLTPQGSLTMASAEERTRVDDMWEELQALHPEERAAIALAAADFTLGRDTGPESQPAYSQLTRFLVTYLDDVLIPGGDRDAVIAQGSGRIRRRRLIAGGLVAALVALIAIPLALFVPQEKATSAKNVGVWSEVAPAPLSPRWSSVASWTGTEALFIGGFTDESCTARSICHGVRDGAAYNPINDTWRTIAPAPFDIAQVSTVQIGDRLFLQGDDGWWFYDATDDEWARIPDPPGVKNVASMTGMQGSLYVVGPGAKRPVQAYDVETNRWSSLPPSSFESGLERRLLVGNPASLLVLGVEPSSTPASPETSTEFQAEVLSDDTWAPLTPSAQKAYLCCWIWTGKRLIHLERMPVYEGENRTGGVRFAGGMTLDFSNSEWGYLPESPSPVQDTETWRLFAWNDVDHPGPLVAFNGYVFDDRDTSWVRLSRPVQAPEAQTSAVWSYGRLIAFGGANFGAGEDESTGTTNRAWIYTPRAPKPAAP